MVEEPSTNNGSFNFGRTAADYEQHRPGFPESLFDRLQNRGWIREDQRILDVGTGTGSLAIGFARRGLHATGLDIAPELLEVARDAAAGARVEFIEAPAERTGLEKDRFDVVSAGQCWWWFDAAAVMDEVKRVLTPGGRLMICTFSYLPTPGGVAGRTEDLILAHNPVWTKAGWEGIHPEQVQDLEDGRFNEVESFHYDVDVPFNHARWRGRIRTCNGVGSSMDSKQVERFDADLAELLATEFQGELVIPHRVFVASGVTG